MGPELFDWQGTESGVRGPPLDFLSGSHGLVRQFSLLPVGVVFPGGCYIMETGGAFLLVTRFGGLCWHLVSMA